MGRTAGLSSLILLLVPLAALAAEEKGKAKEPVYKTPQEVFATLDRAWTQRDWKTYLGCFTPEGQLQLAVERVRSAIADQRAALGDRSLDKERQKRYEPVLKVLDRFGLSYRITQPFQDPKTDQELQAGNCELAKRIKSPVQLYIDLQTAYSRVGAPPPALSGLEVKLVDVKITGDKATATIVVRDTRTGPNGKVPPPTPERKVPIEFVKVGESWKVLPKPVPGQ